MFYLRLLKDASSIILDLKFYYLFNDGPCTLLSLAYFCSEIKYVWFAGHRFNVKKTYKSEILETLRAPYKSVKETGLETKNNCFVYLIKDKNSSLIHPRGLLVLNPTPMPVSTLIIRMYCLPCWKNIILGLNVSIKLVALMENIINNCPK